jgi:hypothetical protein
VTNVRITVAEKRTGARLASGDYPRAYADWTGQIDWPSAPRPGEDHWAHCGDWTAEEFRRVFFYGPPLIGGEVEPAGITVEIETEADVIVHLIAEHGFMGSPG